MAGAGSDPCDKMNVLRNKEKLSVISEWVKENSGKLHRPISRILVVGKVQKSNYSQYEYKVDGILPKGDYSFSHIVRLNA